MPIDIYVDFAVQQQANQRQEEALNTLRQLVNDYPDNSYTLMRLAQGLTLENQFEIAHEYFVQALELAK